jgi:ABC-2 type transport system ATP-binding protein
MMQWIDKNHFEYHLTGIFLGEFQDGTGKLAVPAITRGELILEKNYREIDFLLKPSHIAAIPRPFREILTLKDFSSGSPNDDGENTPFLSIDSMQFASQSTLPLVEAIFITQKLTTVNQLAFIPSFMQIKLSAPRKKLNQIVEIHDLTVHFGKRTILKNASFAVEKGDIMGIIGESGAGKSTTIKAILGELPYTGEIRVMGIDAKHKKRISPLYGYVPQDLSLIYHDFTALENCVHFGRQYGMDEAYLTRRSKQIFFDLNIAEIMDKPVGELSGGQKRRISIAMAMVHNPMLLILDEPTSGLDPMTRFDLWKFLDRINKLYGITLIVISHYLDEIEYSDKSAVYLRGVGFYDYDTPANLKKKLPGKGIATEIILDHIDLRAMTALESITEIEEIVQRGERIRILFEVAYSIVHEKITSLFTKLGIVIYRFIPKTEIDMMDYFTIFSRRLGSGHIFEQARKAREKDEELSLSTINGQNNNASIQKEVP